MTTHIVAASFRQRPGRKGHFQLNVLSLSFFCCFFFYSDAFKFFYRVKSWTKCCFENTAKTPGRSHRFPHNNKTFACFMKMMQAIGPLLQLRVNLYAFPSSMRIHSWIGSALALGKTFLKPMVEKSQCELADCESIAKYKEAKGRLQKQPVEKNKIKTVRYVFLSWCKKTQTPLATLYM